MRPYHAREDSLPFTYGQIENSTRDGVNRGSGSGIAKNKYDQFNSNDIYSVKGDSSTMIKSEQHLKSPQLVRKTLRSPTNTIASVHDYKNNDFGFDNRNLQRSGGGINGNIGNRYYDTYNKLNNNTNQNNNIGYQRSKTPTRNEFEELLRERREKVYNEYRYNAPKPPERHYQPSSRSLTSLTQMDSRRDSDHMRGHYNYDFEFHLNYDKFDDGIPSPPPRQYVRSVNKNYQDINTINNRIRDIDIFQNSSKQSTSEQIMQSNSQAMKSSNLTNLNYDQTDFHKVENNQRYNLQPYFDTEEIEPPIIREKDSKIYYSSMVESSGKQYQSIDETLTTKSQPQQYQLNYMTSSSVKPSGSTSYTPVSPTRPETPAFPVTPRLVMASQDSTSPTNGDLNRHDSTGNSKMQTYSSETIYQTLNHRSRLNSSLSNSEPQEVAAHLVKFAKDSSKFWYKPNLSREEAISLLLDAEPGTFIVRDSTTYKNAFGLVLRVAQMPPYNTSGKLDELVRHFLIEPTTRGVRLKACANEPVFTSLSAFVYEHSINRLGLPCVLRIPEHDLVPAVEHTPAQRQLLTQGAACNVLYLYMCETESLTGEEAIRKAIRSMYAQRPLPIGTEVHFKVTQQGITLTDNTRKKFFRKHYTADFISFCAVDPDYHLWMPDNELQSDDERRNNQKNVSITGGGKTIFAFVARRSSSSKYNQCHVFCDLDIHQPATAIVSYVNRTLPTEKQRNYIL